MWNCAPQFIDRKYEYGNILTKGLFQNLSSVFGVGSFDAGKENQLWTTYLRLEASLHKNSKRCTNYVRRNKIISILFYWQARKSSHNTTFLVPPSTDLLPTHVKSPGKFGTNINISSLKTHTYERQIHQSKISVAWPTSPTPKTKLRTKYLVNFLVRQFASLHKSCLLQQLFT